MKIIYELTEREIEFLKALKTKEHPINAYSGRMSDDAFRKEWKDEISEFRAHSLIDKKDHGTPGSYWEYGLNAKGLALQEQHT